MCPVISVLKSSLRIYLSFLARAHLIPLSGKSFTSSLHLTRTFKVHVQICDAYPSLSPVEVVHIAYSCFLFQDVWNKTWYPKASDHVNTSKPWYVVDATDKILGRLASTIAIHIRGKNLATFTPSVDMGAFVIVVS